MTAVGVNTFGLDVWALGVVGGEWCPSQATCGTGGVFLREGSLLSPLYRVLKEK